jgi:hypothetical protein
MTAVATKKLSVREKDELLKEILGKDYAVAGNHLPFLRDMIDNVGYVDNFFTLAEIIPILNKIFALRIVSITASGASVLAIFLFPIGALISLINANETGVRMYSYRAIAYAITSWAFDKPILPGSKRVMSNIRSGSYQTPKSRIPKREQAWQKSSQDALNKMRSVAAEKNIPIKGLKAFFRMISDNNPQKCCEMLLRGFEKEFSGAPLPIWRANYSIKYPQ